MSNARLELAAAETEWLAAARELYADPVARSEAQRRYEEARGRMLQAKERLRGGA